MFLSQVSNCVAQISQMALKTAKHNCVLRVCMHHFIGHFPGKAELTDCPIDFFIHQSLAYALSQNKAELFYHPRCHPTKSSWDVPHTGQFRQSPLSYIVTQSVRDAGS